MIAPSRDLARPATYPRKVFDMHSSTGPNKNDNLSLDELEQRVTLPKMSFQPMPMVQPDLIFRIPPRSDSLKSLNDIMEYYTYPSFSRSRENSSDLSSEASYPIHLRDYTSVYSTLSLFRRQYHDQPDGTDSEAINHTPIPQTTVARYITFPRKQNVDLSRNQYRAPMTPPLTPERVPPLEIASKGAQYECSLCHQPVEHDPVQIVDQWWHRHHAHCRVCEQPIGTDSFVEIEGFVYCQKHYKRIHVMSTPEKESVKV